MNLTRLHFTGKGVLYLFLALVAVMVLAVIAWTVTKTWVLPALNKIPGASKVTGGAESSQAADHPAMVGLA